MAFCKYCGKQISESGSCDCPEAQAAQAQKAAENVQQQVENAAENVQQQAEKAAENVQQQAENVAENVQQQVENAAENVQQQAENAAPKNQNGYKQLSGSDIAKKVDGLAGGISENLPGNMKNNKSLVYAAAGVIVLLIVLMLLVISTMSGGPNSVVKKYAKSTTDKRGGKTYYSLTYPDDVLKEIKGDGDYRDLIDEYNEMREDEIDYLDGKATMPKFDKITRKEKLSKSQLRRAEEYFEFLCESFDVDGDDIDVTKGYEIKYRSKYKNEDGDKRNLKTTIWVVKVKGDGWKVLNSPLAIG